ECHPSPAGRILITQIAQILLGGFHEPSAFREPPASDTQRFELAGNLFCLLAQTHLLGTQASHVALEVGWRSALQTTSSGACFLTTARCSHGIILRLLLELTRLVAFITHTGRSLAAGQSAGRVADHL